VLSGERYRESGTNALDLTPCTLNFRKDKKNIIGAIQKNIPLDHSVVGRGGKEKKIIGAYRLSLRSD